MIIMIKFSCKNKKRKEKGGREGGRWKNTKKVYIPYTESCEDYLSEQQQKRIGVLIYYIWIKHHNML